MRIYVTGAIRMYGVADAEEEFKKMFDRLKEIGCTDVCSPLEIVKSDLPSEQEKRFEMINSCDMVLFRRDWKNDVMSQKEFLYIAKSRPDISLMYDSWGDWAHLRNLVRFSCS
jgi:hypothetical protein